MITVTIPIKTVNEANSRDTAWRGRHGRSKSAHRAVSLVMSQFDPKTVKLPAVVRLTRLSFGELDEGEAATAARVAIDDDPRALQLETELHGRLALRTDVYVRSDQAWKALIAANPFPEFAAGDPGRLMVQFLKDTPDKKHVGALRAAVRGLEQIRAESRQLYMTYPDGVAGSKLTNNLVEKTLGERVTARSWTTVLALDAAMEQPA